MNQFIELPVSKRSIAQRSPIYGIGVNDAWYKTYSKGGAVCPFYKTWKKMLQRCYSPAFLNRNSSYRDCTISEPWLLFSNFRSWMIKQRWQDMQLDKDILIPGNQVYSPEACLFVPQSLNKLLTDSRASRGKFPLGVTFDARSGKYASQCRANGKSKHIGYYASVAEASSAYKKFKSNHIRNVAEEYRSNVRLYNALIRHSNIILNG